MGLLSIFKRRAAPASTAETAVDSGGAVQQARTRARRRLIGAVVLVGLGVIGFPLVFETQPRPIPVDIPIELPRKDSAAPLAMPPARSPGPQMTTPAAPPPMDSTTSTRDQVITESREDAGRELAAPAPAPSTLPAAPPEFKSAAPASAAPPVKASAPRPADDGARAQALLEGKVVKPVGSGGGTGIGGSGVGGGNVRFVVQVGAFTDAAAAHETRLKAEKMGLKTYTQIANTPVGNRIRVRLGPFATRDEADKARDKARSAGLAAFVQTL